MTLFIFQLVYWLSLAALGFFVVAPKTIVHEPFKWVVFAVVVSLAVDEMCQVTIFAFTTLYVGLQLWPIIIKSSLALLSTNTASYQKRGGRSTKLAAL